jgi:hypothetical protein
MARLRLLVGMLAIAVTACATEESPGDAQLGKEDGGGGGDSHKPGPDGPWQCGVPAADGSAVICTFTWTCSDGQRKISCGYNVVNNVYDCECQNLATGEKDGTFSGPSQTCASGPATITQDANKACGWKLP